MPIAKANVVIVIIATDGTVSTIGPFISPQRARQWLRSEHPEYTEENGINVDVQRMEAP